MTSPDTPRTKKTSPLKFLALGYNRLVVTLSRFRPVSCVMEGAGGGFPGFTCTGAGRTPGRMRNLRHTENIANSGTFTGIHPTGRITRIRHVDERSLGAGLDEEGLGAAEGDVGVEGEVLAG